MINMQWGGENLFFQPTHRSIYGWDRFMASLHYIFQNHHKGSHKAVFGFTTTASKIADLYLQNGETCPFNLFPMSYFHVISHFSSWWSPPLFSYASQRWDPQDTSTQSLCPNDSIWLLPNKPLGPCILVPAISMLRSNLPFKLTG